VTIPKIKTNTEDETRIRKHGDGNIQTIILQTGTVRMRLKGTNKKRRKNSRLIQGGAPGDEGTSTEEKKGIETLYSETREIGFNRRKKRVKVTCLAAVPLNLTSKW